MMQFSSNLKHADVESIDLQDRPDFLRRPHRVVSPRNQVLALHRLGGAFLDRPDAVLQELADTAINLCGADSAGATQEIQDQHGEPRLQLVAAAGASAHLLNATFPFSCWPCGAGLERNRPQLFRVAQSFYSKIGVNALPVTDGLLVPWSVDGTRGTFWVMAHGRTEAFDPNDLRLTETLSSFAAMAIRQQKLLREQSSLAATAKILATRIHHPLEVLTGQVSSAVEGESQMTARELAASISDDLKQISTLLNQLLAMPSGFATVENLPN